MGYTKTFPYTLLISLAVAAVLLAGFLPNVPNPTSATPTPTPTPKSKIQNPKSKIGLHTRLTDEPDPEDIQKEFKMLREMGGAWATEFFPWAYIQATDRNRFDWEHADLVANAAIENGITLIARVDGVPDWAKPEDKTWRYLDREHYDAYGDFIYAFVSHFKGRISHYVIWNEPNLASEWGQRSPDPQGYADLLKIAYSRAKEADPTCVVLLAGLAPNLEREGSSVAMNDLTYLEMLYDAGAAPYFDAVAAHSYGLTSPASDAPDRLKLNFARVQELYNIMAKRGDGAKSVYLTEGGWNDSPRWLYAVKPAQRVLYTVDAYRQAEQWPWLRAVCMWSSRYPRAAYTYFDNYTFLTPDFVPKAVYLEVQRFADDRR